ncbi:MAG TPA: hypothetical protein VLM79_01300 [Kofleriaceae bacterium]|nr:hypothetical protein [Kofleriaceae bacterium]
MSDGRREDDDVAWLLARSNGEARPSISETRASRYEKLEGLLGELPPTPVGATPTEGWQNRVLAAIDAEEAGRAASRRRWIAWLVPLGVATAGAAAVGGTLWLRAESPRARAMAPVLEVHIEAAGARLPAASAMVGDAVVVRGAVDGDGELRVYDDADAEIVRCAATGGATGDATGNATGSAPAADCRVSRSGSRTALELTTTLRAHGAFHPLLIAPPLPGTSAGLDRDLQAARRANLEVVRAHPVIVP